MRVACLDSGTTSTSSIEGLPRPVDDLEGWIEGMAVTFHTRSASIFGRRLLGHFAPPDEAHRGAFRVECASTQYRLRGMSYLVDWSGRRPAARASLPSTWSWAFALNFSVFTTKALMIDFDQSPARVGVLTADILRCSLGVRLTRNARLRERAPAMSKAGKADRGLDAARHRQVDDTQIDRTPLLSLTPIRRARSRSSPALRVPRDQFDLLELPSGDDTIGAETQGKRRHRTIGHHLLADANQSTFAQRLDGLGELRPHGISFPTANHSRQEHSFLHFGEFAVHRVSAPPYASSVGSTRNALRSAQSDTRRSG